MSNPSRAPRETVVRTDGAFVLPDAKAPFMYEERESPEELTKWERKEALYKNIKLLAPLLESAGCDWRIGEPFVIPKEHVLDPKAHMSAKSYRALAKVGKASTRPRTGIAFKYCNAVASQAPDQLRAEIVERSRTLVMADGGSAHTIGRLHKYYPKKGVVPSRPVTPEEARVVWVEELGRDVAQRYLYAAEPNLDVDDTLSEDSQDWTRLPFVDEGDGRAVRTNLHSGNGYPTMMQGTTPGAMERVVAMAAMVREELEGAFKKDPADGVRRWLRVAEVQRPWLVALQGKCKGDYYTVDKLEDSMLRFYYAMGRQMAFNIQTGTQVLESHAQSLLEHEECRSSSGVALNGGGASRTVDALDWQLHQHDRAHARMGDDSWVAMIVDNGERLVQFALDCSSFDLTQHSTVSKEIHDELRRIVSTIDPVAAQLLHAYQRERLVVVMSSLVRHMTHGGSSGLALQSKVNGAVMGVAIWRAQDALEVLDLQGIEITETVVGDVLGKVGSELGLVMKVEQYRSCSLPTPAAEKRPIRYSLALEPFLYLGYQFTHEHDLVSCHADLPRSVTQMRYPNIKWFKTSRLTETMDAVRLMSTVMGWGRPTEPLRPMFRTAFVKAIQLLDRELRLHGDHANPAYRWAVQLAAQTEVVDEVTMSSLSGLRAAGARILELDFANWLAPNGEPITLFRDDEGFPAATLLRRSMSATPRVNLRSGALRPPSRLPTTKTDGRNPNTKVFGPPRPPRARNYRAHENADATGDDLRAMRADHWASVRVGEEGQAHIVRPEYETHPEEDYDGPADEMDDDKFGVEIDQDEAEGLFDGRLRVARRA